MKFGEGYSLQSINHAKVAISVCPHPNELGTWERDRKGTANTLQVHQGGPGTGSTVLPRSQRERDHP